MQLCVHASAAATHGLHLAAQLIAVLPADSLAAHNGGDVLVLVLLSIGDDGERVSVVS